MDAIEEINKAKALLDDGLINDDEFKILKAEILSKAGNISTNEDKQTSISKKSAQKARVKKDTQGKSLKTNEKSIPIEKRSSQVDTKVLTKSKQEKEKVKLESKSQSIDKEEISKDTSLKQTVENTNKTDYYKVKVLFFLLGLVIFLIISFSSDSELSAFYGVFGGLIAMAWWAQRMGKRSLFFFFAPYILFAFSLIQFIYGPHNSGDFGEDTETVLICVGSIIELLAFLVEYFMAQAKCSNCGKRSGMMKISESGFSSYNYIGTKSYDIRSKGGEKIGEYEGPVSRTAYNFTAQYHCKYCKNYTSRRESEHYDN